MANKTNGESRSETVNERIGRMEARLDRLRATMRELKELLKVAINRNKGIREALRDLRPK